MLVYFGYAAGKGGGGQATHLLQRRYSAEIALIHPRVRTRPQPYLACRRHTTKPRIGEPTMIIGHQKGQRPRRAWLPCLLVLAGAVVVSAAGSGAAADEQSGAFATACALKEIKVITLIEDHGEGQDGRSA